MSQAYIASDLRVLVRQRAAEACEYCLVREGFSFFTHEIDHIIAEQHGGETVESNLALACIVCNKYKGPNVASIDPLSGNVVSLFHPRLDRWEDHFALQEARIEPKTDEGRATARLLRFNTTSRFIERKALIAVGGLRSP